MNRKIPHIGIEKSDQLMILRIFPFKKLFKLIFGLAVCVQLIVISYNHWSGFHIMDSYQEFFFKLFWGIILSMLGGFSLAVPDLFVIRQMNKVNSWNKQTLKRVVIQFLLTILVAIVVSTSLTLISHSLKPYEEDLTLVLIYNAMIFAVCNVILVITLEALLFFMENSENKKVTQSLEKELSQIRFEVLKNQINPHFMFNSLNVLSGLINKNKEKAQQFIDEFSLLYRYVLESIEKPVVTLSEELGFARSYMFLQQIRYSKDLQYSVNVPSNLLGSYLPPLSLQVVLENAIKHNLISSDQPLKIDISHDSHRLIITNNLQLKISSKVSTGLGQSNLIKRYKMISDEQPQFQMLTERFIAILPLINDEDESFDN